VEIDSGIAILPEATVQQEVANQSLCAVKIHDSDSTRPLAMIYKKSRVLSPAMKKFVTLLKEDL
jgi:DNA-binding transcriptional LysR family regulator